MLFFSLLPEEGCPRSGRGGGSLPEEGWHAQRDGVVGAHPAEGRPAKPPRRFAPPFLRKEGRDGITAVDSTLNALGGQAFAKDVTLTDSFVSSLDMAGRLTMQNSTILGTPGQGPATMTIEGEGTALNLTDVGVRMFQPGASVTVRDKAALNGHGETRVLIGDGDSGPNEMVVSTGGTVSAVP